MALYRNAVLAAFIAPSGNISPACLQSVPTAAIPFLPSKIKVAHLLPERKSIMDNKIEVFKNEQFGEIRTALIENKPWFVAVDVCRALEIGNSSQAISRLDADEKMWLLNNPKRKSQTLSKSGKGLLFPTHQGCG